MSQKIDARGLSCPQPVILAKKAMDRIGKGALEIAVDTATAKENVIRVARHAGFNVTVAESSREWLLKLEKE